MPFFCEVSLLPFIFHAGKPISSGKVVIDVSYFGVHVHTENHDLSEEISCPIAAGKFVLSHSQTLPGFTPPVSLILLDLNSCSTYQPKKKERFKLLLYVLIFKVNSSNILTVCMLNHTLTQTKL